MIDPVITIGIVASIFIGLMAWPRCITANHANLSWQDHQDRINAWRERIKGCVVVGFSYGAACSSAFFVTRNELWAVWSALGLNLNAMAFCLMLFPLQLHLRHQKGKPHLKQTTMAGK